MNNERQPLLHQDVEQHRSIARPDLRNSPENVIVDGNDTQSSDGESDDDGKQELPNSTNLLQFQNIKMTQTKRRRFSIPLAAQQLTTIPPRTGTWSIPRLISTR